MARPLYKILPASIFALLGLGYVISYLPRRAEGAYRMTQSGDIRYQIGLPVSDLSQWNPNGCWWQPHFRNAQSEPQSRGNSWGYFYSPLITLDRKLSFPDKIILPIENLPPPLEN